MLRSNWRGCECSETLRRSRSGRVHKDGFPHYSAATQCMTMNQYTVDLRIEGEALSPEQVTLDLGLQPSVVRRKGDRRGPTVLAKSMWAFSGREIRRDCPSIEEGLQRLLEEVAPLRPIMEPYFQTCSVYWWCGSFQSDFGRTMTFSAQLFELLAAFGAPVHLSSYFSEDAGARPPATRSTF